MANELTEADLGRIGDRLGKGGQATVYRLSGFKVEGRPTVYKKYHRRQSGSGGANVLIGKRAGFSPGDRAKLDSISVWPVRSVRDDSGVLGVVLPLIPKEFFQRRTLPTGKVSRDPREAQNLLVAPSLAERVGMPLMSLRERYAVCRDLAAALAFLHERGLVFGDVNAKNVLFRKAESDTIMLVDCDAVRVRGQIAVNKQLNAPDWDPPEGNVLSQATDLYKLGLFVLRVLHPGAQASISRAPDRAAPLLTGAGPTLLTRALGTEPSRRPSALAWERYLSEIAAIPSDHMYKLLSPGGLGPLKSRRLRAGP